MAMYIQETAAKARVSPMYMSETALLGPQLRREPLLLSASWCSDLLGSFPCIWKGAPICWGRCLHFGRLLRFAGFCVRARQEAHVGPRGCSYRNVYAFCKSSLGGPRGAKGLLIQKILPNPSLPALVFPRLTLRLARCTCARYAHAWKESRG